MIKRELIDVAGIVGPDGNLMPNQRKEMTYLILFYSTDPDTGEQKTEIFGKLTLVDGIAEYSYDDYTGDNSTYFAVPAAEGVSQYGVIERALEYNDIEDVDLLRNAAVQGAAGPAVSLVKAENSNFKF